MVSELMDSRRIAYIDVAKALAMILMIVGHSLAPSYLLNAIYSFHMPLFFFVSGYFYKKRGYVELIKHNIKRLIIPYLITCGVLVSINVLKAMMGKGWGGVAQSVFATVYCCGKTVDYGLLTIPSCGAIWFLPALLCAMVFLNFALNVRRPLATIAIISLISWASARYFLLPFGIQAGGFASLFLYAGYAERNKVNLLSVMGEKKYVPIVFSLIWLPCFLFGGLFEMVVVSAPMLPLNVAGAFCGTYIFLYFCKWLDSLKLIFENKLVAFGQSTMIVLCVHLLDIRLIPWARAPWLNDGHAQTFEAFAFIFSLRLTLAVLAVWWRGRSKLLQSVF